MLNAGIYTESDGSAYIPCGCMLHVYVLAPLIACYMYILLVTCMNNSHTPGVDTAIDEDVGVGVTVEDAVVVKPGGKHPVSSISEQQSPKL